MRQYIFDAVGGTHRLSLAVMATFAINGLVHEYVFGIAAGRILGWAMLFFVIQGIATLATMRLRPRGAMRIIGIALTLAFNLATGVLFFACVNAVRPFYVRR